MMRSLRRPTPTVSALAGRRRALRTAPSSLLFLAALLALLGPRASAQDPDDPMTGEDGWHFTVAPYLWATGMEGTISFEGTPDIPVDASFAAALG